MDRIAVRNILPVALLACGIAAGGPAFAGERVLYDFPSPEVGQPTGPLLLQGGALFGTGTASIEDCCGEVFELTNSNGSWQEQTLATFDDTNGGLPYGGVIADANGVLYGTTAYGGNNRAGIVFAVSNSGNGWSLQPIWQFGGPGDGQDPFGPVVMDKSGTIYGETFYGGRYGNGTVFSLAQQNGAWSETILYSFCSGASACGKLHDGQFPEGGLLLGPDGKLYGTTTEGGATGQGTVFSLSQSGGVWTENTIWNFGNSGDGVYPAAALVADGTGALYGTTFYGGTQGYGTVFRLAQSGGVWNESVIWNFSNQSDGGSPDSSLYLGSHGTLYGTASSGGAGDGVIFALSQSGGQWTEKTVHTFEGPDGRDPESALIAGGNGLLYATTALGGTNSAGTVFQLRQKN